MKAEHAELAMETYVADLLKYDPLFVDVACHDWRTAPGNKFFPAIGELMAIIVPMQQRQDEHDRADPSEARQFPKPDMRYTGKYAGWESLSDHEKCLAIVRDVPDIEVDGDPHGLAKMGRTFLEHEGWEGF